MPLDGPSVADTFRRHQDHRCRHTSERAARYVDLARAGAAQRAHAARKDGRRQAHVGHRGDDRSRSASDGASPISVIRKDGSKSRSLEFFNWQIEDVHAGAYNTQARLKVMDETNIFAQIVYPNILGFGGQNATKVDPELRLASIQIFNDAMAEMQAESNGRIFPMALLPWWDVEASAKETERSKAMGLRGVNINSDPHNLPGTPDLTSTHWDRLWETCAGIDMPVNFHIGASRSGHRLVRHFLLAGSAAGHPIRHRLLDAVLRQRAGDGEHPAVGHPRPPSDDQVRLGRKRHRLGALSARDDRISAGGETRPAANSR